MLSGLGKLSALHLALGLSLAVHAALLTVRFIDPQSFDRVFKDTPLEVILVNAASEQAPEQAQAIAQVALAGGGAADRGRASSPLPPAAQARLGESAQEDQQRIDALKEQQHQLLVQVRQQLAMLALPELPAERQNPQASEREQQRLALVNMLAAIEQRIQEENQRPRKRFISPATREAVYAIYHDELRRRIEDHGTRNFPSAGGRKLHGELTMLITVNHTGEVLHTEVVQASDIPLLDRRAQAIVHSLRFDRFTPAMRRQADQLVVVSRFRFTRDETLQAQLSNP
ncbi:energy transducer TonB [Hydrogenophaga sp.]|uniref:energy transducer TonB n=1 Tax=Hydrogenophaga sp. TaxID=1904254 RepID=UPI0019987735|nr:energy transducer TonB [Hydrogenophaga sp.]MBD3893778.1 energy transducer TonB [Hydrogenophaga sp.]